LPESPDLLRGRRVLVVEDEVLVSITIENWLAEFGCEIVAVASLLPEAIEKMNNSDFDIAVLDVNLAGERSYPIAEALTERGIPFIVATGYAAEALPESMRRSPTLQKPFDKIGLKASLRAALATSRS